MRILVIGLGIVLILLVSGGLVVSSLPLSPALQHVENRIPDAQIPR